LFDSELLDDWETCLEYMYHIHGFSIPDIERVNDMEGLCHYLQLKVNHCYRCLYSSKRFKSREAVKHYMESKGNKRFNSDTFKVEFERFYAPSREALIGGNLTQEQLDETLERGFTPSGKILIPRDMVTKGVHKQRVKPEEARTSVLAVKAETTERILKTTQGGKPGQLALFKPGATPRSEITKKYVTIRSKYMLRQNMNANKLYKLSDAALTHGK